MFGKLFKSGTVKKPAPASATVVVAETVQAKPETPSILQQLTQGQPIDSIHDIDTLQQLVKHSDKLGKKTNQQVRDRLHALREQEKNRQQQHEKQEKICVRLETLSRLQHHPLFDSEFTHLQQQWDALPDKDTALVTRVSAAIAQCRQIQADALAEKQQQEQAAREAATRAEQERLLAEQRAAEQAEKAQQYAEKIQASVAAAEDKQKSAAEQQKKTEQVIQTLQQQLTQTEEAIAKGDSKKARETLDRIRDNLKKIEPRRAHSFEGKLHLLTGQLRDLQDWQNYAGLPKLEALCAEMEKLVDTSLPVLQKADAVHDLQNQWRALKVPTSKQSQALWDRFKKASDTAWEPCAEYFAKEKKLRAFNLQQRQAICDALEQFFTGQDWEKADWKAVSRILEKSKQEFHDFHPVERTEEKTIRARFDAALKAINNKLLDEQKNNEEKKRQLVEAAKSIATMTDLDKAAERVRQLQEQWKQIGLTRRHEDQKLWQALQEQTGLVFEKRRASQQQQQQALHDTIEQARHICEQIAALARLNDAALAQSSSDFDRLQAEYKAITGIPEKNQQSIKKQFYAACDAYRNQLAGISKRQRQQQLQELARRSALCAQLEQHASAENIHAVENAWQQLALPAEWEQAIERRRQQSLAAAQNGQSPDFDTNEQLLRELCVELEILMDLETPAEDRQRRRDYQMRKLQQGLGQSGNSNRHEQLERLQIAWYCASPAAPAVQSQLQQRFDLAATQGR